MENNLDNANITTNKMIKKWVNKDGSITTKEYDQSKYTKKYYEKNKDKYLLKHTCGCGVEYSHSNKYQHINTRLHKMYHKMTTNITNDNTL